MSKVADLYIRVSTDEQAKKGFSQRHQEEVLKRYCAFIAIEVRNVIFEDYSAKTFKRPACRKLLVDIKRQKNKIDFLLFTKWDRFSRNTGDAYQMISFLRKLGVDPQAVEQPLDLSIPENKMMLAFYLAIPEVENDRRSLNVIDGMLRGKKEGRCMGRTPVGYVNKTREDGTKYVQTDEPDASIIKWAFEEIARGIFNTETVFRMAKRKGLSCTKNNFWFVLRNPFYCGKLFIPKYKNEESQMVKGQHDPVISDGLFYTVQDVLVGRSRDYRTKYETDAEFPLRGFVICPQCGKFLCGSKSKGRNKYYSYYHCFGGCNYRESCDKVHSALDRELERYIPRREYLKLYSDVILEEYNKMTGAENEEQKTLIAGIKDYRKRLEHARDLLGKQEISSIDYRDMKSDYTAIIEKMEAKLSMLKNETPDVEGLLDEGIQKLLKLSSMGKFNKNDRNKIEEDELSEARDLISTIFPNKITYENGVLRTTKLNELVNCIYLINNELDEDKNWISDLKNRLSSKVA